AARPRSLSATSGSGTTIRRSPPFAAKCASETSAATAPASQAALTKSWPSNCSPLMATNSASGPSSRESIDTDDTGPSSSPSGRPPVAATISDTVHSGHKTQFFQRLRHDFMVGKMVPGGADDLIVLMALAGNQHDVARPHFLGGSGNRLAAVADFLGTADGGEDFGTDCRRVLRPRIVVGDDDP